MSLHYVPAGVEAYTGLEAQLHVTYRKAEKEHSVFGKKFKSWHTLDKVVTMVKGGVKYSAMAPTSDVAIPMASAAFVASCGLTKVLANPIHKAYNKQPFEALGIESIVDSGGFQLLKGTVPFVEPDEVIARYNEHANIGMPLDLPITNEAEPFYFHAVSRMIKANDDYITQRLDKGIDLALISHGTNLKLRRERLDILDRDAKVVAIAGLNIKPEAGVDHIYNSAENLMYVVHRYRKRARYFHVLGVTSKLWVFIYAVLSVTKYVQSIGADSVSHRLGALVGMYDQYDFSTRQFSRSTPYVTTLNCNCPICTTIDDSRIIQETNIMEAHNLWVRAKQTELLESMASSYVKGQLPIAEVYKFLGLSMGLNRFVHLMRYIEEIIASDKYKPLRSSSVKNSLFDMAPPKMDPKMDAHYRNVITAYEKFHEKKFIIEGERVSKTSKAPAKIAPQGGKRKGSKAPIAA